MRNLPSGFPTRSDTDRAVQPRKIDRDFQFRIKEVEGLYYLSSENKGAVAFAYAKARFSHDAA